MSQQLQITGGAKVRNLQGVITGTSGVLNSLPINTANGIPQLDSSGKILVEQLPNSIMEYKGTWNVSTNTPYLVNGVGNAGDVYIVTGAATGGTNHDFGAGNILFYNGDQAIYDGSAWQRASGSTGSVTSVAMTTPTGLSVTGSPITTSGTLALSLSSGYIIPTTSFLNGLVPYTGATQTVDLGSYDLNARGIKINGTAGTGHADFKHQSGTPTGSASSSTLYADTDGDLAWKNDHSYTTTFIGSSNTADRDYTLPNASGTLALTSDLSSFVSASPIGIAGNIPYFTGSYTLGNENGFMYDSSTNRFGVNTTVPNATIGANASIDSGYSLLLKNADANYNGLGFGLDSTYGNLITTQKIGTAAARNFTLQNQSGYISLDESGNLGVNILNPKGGIDIYNSTTAALYLHNTASGVAATDGVRLSLNSTNANLRNYEAGTLSMTSEGDFSIITAATENFRVNSADGSIYQSKVANAMLKSVSGVITAAVAGTDYVAPSALSGYVPTSRTLTINGTTYDLSANRSWSVGTTTGSGSADSVAFWNSSSNLTYDSVFYYSSTNKRLGVNTTSPNATIGANAGIDSGYSLLLKNAETNYNGLAFGVDSTYGNLITTAKIGTAAARNFTLQNQSGYISIDENGALGVNILTPKGGLDVYNSTNAYLYLHTATSGVTATDGVRLALFSNNNANLRNFESGTFSITSESDFSVITAATENFRVNASDGSIYQSKVPNALLKSVSGVITAAVAGTDYQTPITNPVSGTGTATRVAFWTASNTISSNANLYWDNTNSRLGIGTASNISNALTIYSLSEASQLKVAGGAPGIAFTEALSGQQYLGIVGLATLSNNYITNTTAGDMAIANQTSGKSIFFGINSTEVMRMTSGGLSITGTKSQLTLTGNSSNGAGITLNTLISGADRRNWGIFTEQNVNGDFVIKKSSSAGGNPYTGDNVLSFTNTGAATFSSSIDAAGRVLAGSSANTSNAFSGINNSTAQATIYSYNHSASGWSIYSAQGINYFAGNVGIGTTSPTQTLTVKGIIQSDRDNANYYGAWLSGSTNANSESYLGLGIWYNRAGYLKWIDNSRFAMYTANSNPITLQESGGNVLIGTTTDSGYKLNVNGTGRFSGDFLVSGSSNSSWIGAIDNQGTTNANGLYVNIGASSTGKPFAVYKNFSQLFGVENSGAATFSSSVTATAFFESSDKRLKKEISDNPIIESISNIKPKLYIKDGKEELGYYAQDLESVLPSAVSEGKDGFLTLSYSQVLVAKVANLEGEITELKQIVKTLINELGRNSK